MKSSKNSKRKKKNKHSKNGVQLKNDSLNNLTWTDRMEKTHTKSFSMFKNILTLNGYLSFEAAFSQIENSYGMFKEFLENQGVTFSATVEKTSKNLMESAIETGLKKMEARLKIA